MFLRSRVAFFLFVFSVFAHASKLPTSFDGYVTSVSGTDAFDVGTRHVKIDRAKTEVTLPDQGVDAENFVDWVLRVGAIVHVDGTFEKGTNAFVATAVTFKPAVGANRKRASGA